MDHSGAASNFEFDFFAHNLFLYDECGGIAVFFGR
jgi:hypothetical protein